MSRSSRITRGFAAPVIGVVLIAVEATPAFSAPILFSGAGAGAQTAFNDFLAAIGPTPRRIGWDGVRVDGTDANPATVVIVPNSTVAIPVNRFQAVGALYTEFNAVSDDGFSLVNPATAGQFPAFTSPNTFAPFNDAAGSFDDNTIEQSFVFPGTTNPAGTRGFGAMFLDVELPGSSSIEYFGRLTGGTRVSLGKFNVPVANSAEPSFLGVLFDGPVVADVVLTVGTNALFNFNGATVNPFGPENLATGTDLAVTDDFLFANPTQLQIVPEPSTLSMAGIAALLGIGYAWRRRMRAA